MCLARAKGESLRKAQLEGALPEAGAHTPLKKQ